MSFSPLLVPLTGRWCSTTSCAVAALALLSPAVAAAAAAADATRPNIVVFIADDHSQLDSQA